MDFEGSEDFYILHLSCFISFTLYTAWSLMRCLRLRSQKNVQVYSEKKLMHG